MNNQLFEKLMLALLMLASLVLPACTSGTLQVMIESTATIPPQPTMSPTTIPSLEQYVNTTYGFTFIYSPSWTLDETPHEITLSQDSLTLRVAYRWANESVNIAGERSGLPAGDFIYGDKVWFLEKAIPAQVLEYERKDKAVFYGGPGTFEVEDLVFAIWLEDLAPGAYEALDISKAQQEEVKIILESFKRVGASASAPTPTPSPDTSKLLTYSNETYGLSLQYPSDWKIQDQDTHYVRLGEGSVTLYLGFMWLYESVEIRSHTEPPAGTFESRNQVPFLGQELSREVLVDEGNDRAVFYNGAASWIQGQDISFSIALESRDADSGGGISEELQATADRIVASVRLASSSEMISYANPEYGFAFEYPDSWTLEAIPGQVLDYGRLADALVLHPKDESLSQGKMAITIQYMHMSDMSQGGWQGLSGPYAEASRQGKITLIGQETQKLVWSYDGEIKVIEVNAQQEQADLALMITLRDDSVKLVQEPEAAPVPQYAILVLDQILNSFVLTG